MIDVATGPRHLRGLALAVLCAGLFAAARVRNAELPPATGSVGTDVSHIVATDESGARRSLARGRRTVFYVFDSRCAHCVAHADEWGRWLESHRDAPTVALTSEQLDRPTEFAAGHGWRTEVMRLRPSWLGLEARSVMARTPWIFVVSGDGIVEASLYGGEIEALSRTIARTPSLGDDQ